MFLSPLENVGYDGTGGAGGYANVADVDSKNLAIFITNLDNKDTFAHEISHILGLPHTFKGEHMTEERIMEANKFVKEVDNYFNSLINNNTPKSEIAEKWEDYKEDYASSRGLLQVYYNYLNKGMFYNKEKTENIMDYSDNRKSYFYWQWKIMQYEIKKYY